MLIISLLILIGIPMILKKDGIHSLKPDAMGPSSVLYVSGSAGGGTATLGYIDATGGFVPLVDGVIIVGDQYTIDHGFNMDLQVQLTGSTSPALEIIRCSKG